jgi:hypothetical protein
MNRIVHCAMFAVLCALFIGLGWSLAAVPDPTKGCNGNWQCTGNVPGVDNFNQPVTCQLNPIWGVPTCIVVTTPPGCIQMQRRYECWGTVVGGGGQCHADYWGCVP